ncbi:hypothetical protein ACL02T_29830 [Pseudonocardia sp. RS010]|uniref:hypothetical protein n=1 Tax=Pseudonocardia sp. RS010 TaxID=3385979 RepID=UPI0039A0320C
MTDQTPRFAANTSKRQTGAGELPDGEYSGKTYGAAADVVAEVREHLERLSAALREGKI